ncbi:hypothetical protein BaDB11_02262 [Bacillus licheniformis]|uniref:hypothetical protein n=1 Tax=Bacillus licheniformis TaxID=1402 RepID=UPI0009C24ECA|nr:hypothetical protein [Bacillus licheniformis]ARC60902.1 hypothetical protein BaDB11_02262 [Bacillus licheniformis]
MKSDIEKRAECGLQNGTEAMMNRESQRLDAALYGAVLNAFGCDERSRLMRGKRGRAVKRAELAKGCCTLSKWPD